MAEIRGLRGAADPSPSRRYHDAVPQDSRREPTLDEPLNPTSASDLPPAPGDRRTPDPAGPSSDGDAPGTSESAASSGPAPLPPPEAPSLGEQIGATKDSVKGLVGAHVELAKSEFSDIVDAVKRAAVFVGIAVAAGLVAGLLLIIGLPLFLGEALFGSMGWGILLGVLMMFAIATAASVVALRPGIDAPIGRPFLVAVLVAVVVGVLLGLDLTNRAWSAVADAIVPAVDAGIRPLAVAVIALLIVGALLGLIGGALVGGGGGAVVAGLAGGAIAGVLLGWLTAFAPGPRVGAAIGVATGLLVWMGLLGAGVARGGFDMDALKTRFWPERTIAVTKETIEWARERMPLSRRS